MIMDVKGDSRMKPVDIEDSDLFKSLQRELIAPIVKIAKLEEYPAKTVIFREEDPNHDLRVLRAGTVRLMFTEPNGWQYGEFMITTIRPGQAFGWTTLSGQEKTLAQAVAIDNCEAYLIPIEGLRHLCSNNFELGYHVMHKLLQVMGKRLKDTRSQLRWLLSNT